MGALRWILVIVGLTAILVALAWTWVTSRRRIDDLLAHLHDDDPRVRARAGVSILEERSRRAAMELQTYLMNEPDARARLAVALAVAGRVAQGTHGDFEQWAAAELADTAALATPAVLPMVEPSSVSPVAAVHPPQAVAYAMADAAPPADHAIHWRLEPDS